MKVGFITKPNYKGQIVIPKEIRDILHIDATVPLNMSVRGHGMYLYPITGVITDVDHEDSYQMVLIKTRGTWSEDKNFPNTKKRKRELAASQKRKQI